MPPKAKFTKEQIVEAALRLVSERGMEKLTARELGAALGSSARPIFTVFQSMEEVQTEVRAAVKKRFDDYVKDAEQYTLEFKQMGMRMIRFALEEPKLYQLLLMREDKEAGSLANMLTEAGPMPAAAVEWLCKNHGITQEDARVLFQNIWIHTYGIGALCATGMCRFSEEEISEMVSRNYEGMMMLAKAGRLHEHFEIPTEKSPNKMKKKEERNVK